MGQDQSLSIYIVEYCSSSKDCDHSHDRMILEFVVRAKSEDHALTLIKEKYPKYEESAFSIEKTLPSNECFVELVNDSGCHDF